MIFLFSSLFSFISSKRSHGQTDLAPRKALKTAPDCVASAAPGLVIQPTLSRGTSPQGARAFPVLEERAPEAGSSAEAAIVVEEAADANVALSPPVVPAMPAPATAEVAAVPVGERPVAAGVGMADASAPKASEEVGVDARSVQPGDSLIAVRRSPEARRPLLRFRTLSLFSTMSRRTSPGMSSASVRRQRWGRSGRRWRFSAETSPKSSR